MQRTIRVSLAVGVGVLALAAAGLHGAKAADMGVGVPQYQAPPPAAYGPPPAQEGYAYPPPPPAYVYPPPPPPVAYYYPPPAYEVVPEEVYYGPGPYWRGGPRFAYGYSHWGHGHWGHGWHR